MRNLIRRWIILGCLAALAAAALSISPVSPTSAAIVVSPERVDTRIKLKGSWSGTINQTDGYVYTAAVEFASNKKARVHYGAPFDCYGKWTLMSHSHGVYAYSEIITRQGGSVACTNETVYISVVSVDQLQYSAPQSYGASGILMRQM